MTTEKFYLTTAITYANAKPHIGHAYEEIATDVLARWKRMLGQDVMFVTGSDEHSTNVEARAKELGQTPQDYCDGMARVFQDTWKALNISNDRFIRTSDPKHHRASQEMIRRAQKSGDIYKDRYEGWYCNSCETYYIESNLKDGGLCPVHQTKTVWLAEENYFFRLSKYVAPVKRHIEDNPEFVQPETRRNEILNILRAEGDNAIRDISISRSSTSWGIPFPDDPQHVVYVWFDALINYISAIGFASDQPEDQEAFKRFWPADVHVIGKDITRFHCIIWPAMLMSAGLPLPKRVFGHGFLYLKGEKISKTRGNVLDPLDLVRDYGVDPVRYVLMAANSFAADSDFSEEALIDRFNSDLANDLGNLLNRSLTMVEKYCEGRVPVPPAVFGGRWDGPAWEQVAAALPLDAELQRQSLGLSATYAAAMERLDFSGALGAVLNLVKRANKYIDEASPWALFKQGALCLGDYPRVNLVMFNLLETLRLAAVYVQPFMPATTPRMLAQLGYAEADRMAAVPAAAVWGLMPSGQTLAKDAPLFPRIEKEKK